ncbi:MAG TPA: sugar phosphate isomerase/epimerase family protein [Ktedonobacteraceae bacterium]|jgi:fatty-acyl-CoA synthase
MKLAFSTLGCPAWSAEQVITQAVQMGYDGIELRLLDGELIDPQRDEARVISVIQQCRAKGLEVCALDTSCRFNIPDAQERARQEADLEHWIQLAEKVQVPLLRIFGGAVPPATQSSEEEENAWLVASLKRVAPLAEQAKVTVVLETHDAFSSARRVGRVLDAINSPAIAALWDSHHPYRVGESAQEVVAALGSRIVHVHVKDALRKGAESSDWQLVLVGEGEVPVKEQLAALVELGYTGYVSIEWEKRWHPEIAEPEIALPQHIAWLKQLPYFV